MEWGGESVAPLVGLFCADWLFCALGTESTVEEMDSQT